MMFAGSNSTQGAQKLSLVSFAALAVVACLLMALLAGCGGSGSAASGSAGGALKDGTYEGQSKVHDDGVEGDGYAVITLTIKDGQIVDAILQPYQVDGTPKDSDYGKDGTRYAVAQKAISAGEDYAKELVEAGALEGVDAISGATYLYDQFVEATEDALSKAAQ